jgi:hypothetical protein
MRRRPAAPAANIITAGSRKLAHDPSRYRSESARGTRSARPMARITPAFTLTMTLGFKD